MEINWLIIVIVIVAAVLLIVLLVWRNLKDKKEITQNIIDQDEVLLPKEPDNEVDTTI